MFFVVTDEWWVECCKTANKMEHLKKYTRLGGEADETRKRKCSACVSMIQGVRGKLKISNLSSRDTQKYK